MDPTEDYSLEDFQKWHVTHLKEYLAKRGLSKNGKKSELAALAFSCHVMNKPIIDLKCATMRETFQDYQAILSLLDGIQFPDPFKISTGWISEKEGGMKYWPPISIVDIIDFFREQQCETGQMLSQYKAGKAYDYFKTAWLKEIYYNSVNQFSTRYTGIGKYSLLRAKCTPSQRINDPDHDVWVITEKESGCIVRSFCNCTAG